MAQKFPRLGIAAASMIAEAIGSAIVNDWNDRDTEGYASSATLDEIRVFAIAVLASAGMGHMDYPQGIGDTPIRPND